MIEEQPRDLDRRADLGLTALSVLDLADKIERVNRASTGLFGRIESLTGLRHGELQVLLAVSEGADHPRTVARDTGQADSAAAATVGALIHRGLVSRHHHPASPTEASRPTLLHLTERGAVVVRQVEGIRIRVAEALALALGDRRAAAARASLDDVARAMEDTSSQ